jgi:hypothetical protein
MNPLGRASREPDLIFQHPLDVEKERNGLKIRALDAAV